MAPQYALDRQPAAPERSVFAEGVLGITGAGRLKTATVSDEWGQGRAININEKNERVREKRNALSF